jgi:redox-sensitive bicupin YhaK (pirin superfamily)
MKKLHRVHRGPDAHWVGDGFPVRSIFSHQRAAPRLSPFLLLDYAGPAEFPPSAHPRGVGEHPHRGFETVTIVYQGEVEHRDSAGNAGAIGPGDVQWMTAGSGVLHEEMHSREFTRRGGTLEMVQLWVNLPARYKRSPPRYQTLLARDVPTVSLADGAGELRVIAGDFAGAKGPAHTFTPIDLFDLRARAGARLELPLRDGDNTALFVLHGRACSDDSQVVGAAELAVFERPGEGIALRVAEDLTALVLSGQSIDEPVVGYGPFVMNDRREIEQAIRDFEEGSFGEIGGAGAQRRP